MLNSLFPIKLERLENGTILVTDVENIVSVLRHLDGTSVSEEEYNQVRPQAIVQGYWWLANRYQFEEV